MSNFQEVLVFHFSDLHAEMVERVSTKLVNFAAVDFVESSGDYQTIRFSSGEVVEVRESMDRLKGLAERGNRS